MKFLNALDSQEIMSVIDVLSMSMLYYNDIKSKHIKEDPSIIDSLAKSIVLLARHNANVKSKKDLAILSVDPEDLVRKVERNGKVLGVINGGRA